jgi:hypothetical protein
LTFWRGFNRLIFVLVEAVALAGLVSRLWSWWTNPFREFDPGLTLVEQTSIFPFALMAIAAPVIYVAALWVMHGFVRSSK